MVIILTYYLVDTENVHTHWGMKFCKKSKLVLFYTLNNSHLAKGSVETIAEYVGGTTNVDKFGAFYYNLEEVIEDNSVEFETVNCFEGKNALDFQLVSWLAVQVTLEPNANYYIISNDQGYDAVVKMWNSKGIKVRRVERIMAEKAKVAEIKPRYKKSKHLSLILQKEKETVRSFFAELLDINNTTIINTISNWFVAEPNNIDKLCRKIQNVYGKKKGVLFSDKIRYNQSKINQFLSTYNKKIA